MESHAHTFPRRVASRSRTLLRLALFLVLALLSAGCTALSTGATPTPETDCLALIPDEELNTLYPLQELWPIEDCREAYAAAWWMTGSGEHFRLTEVTQIMRVEAMPRAAAEEIARDPYRTVPAPSGAETAWLVVLRGRFVLEPPIPYPFKNEEVITPQPAYGCMFAIVDPDTQGSFIGSIDCPSHPSLATLTP